MANDKVKITIEDMGDIIVELYPDKAPISAANFLSLVKSNFYNGLIFHRVIPGFMIQGGGMDAEFNQKHTDSISGEFASNGCKTNDIKHTRGVLSMARTMDPNSASSQFFIMHQDSPHLDGQYAAFGKVIEGMDIVDMIANTHTVSYGFYNDVPSTPIVIKEMSVL